MSKFLNDANSKAIAIPCVFSKSSQAKNPEDQAQIEPVALRLRVIYRSFTAEPCRTSLKKKRLVLESIINIVENYQMLFSSIS